MAKLRLTADSYERVTRNDRGDIIDVEAFTRGDVIDPRDDAEAKRLVDIGAAEDPQQSKQRASALEEQAQRLRAEAERLESQESSQPSPEEAEKQLAERREQVEREQREASQGTQKSSKSKG